MKWFVQKTVTFYDNISIIQIFVNIKQLIGLNFEINRPKRLVGKYQPDILCLEEIYGKWCLESFAENSGYQNHLFSSNGHSTVAILSKQLSLKLVVEAKSRGESIRTGTVNSSIEACLLFNYWTFGAVLTIVFEVLSVFTK